MSQKLIIILFPVVLIIGTLMIYRSYRSIKSIPVISDNPNPVRVDFFVMSKCPDATICELLFIPSLIKLSSITNFTVSFIGRESKSNQFECMHGPDECTGNKQQLCVQNMYSQIIFLKFLQCQTKHIELIPNNGAQCAKEVAGDVIKWDDVQSCVTSDKVNEVFRKSLQRTRSASVKNSCTIHLNGKYWCMHNGNWFKCSEGHDEMSFTKAICSRYNGKNVPAECAAFA